MLHCKTVWWREGIESPSVLPNSRSRSFPWLRRSPWRKGGSFPTRYTGIVPGCCFCASLYTHLYRFLCEDEYIQISHPRRWCFFLPLLKKNQQKKQEMVTLLQEIQLGPQCGLCTDVFLAFSPLKGSCNPTLAVVNLFLLSKSIPGYSWLTQLFHETDRAQLYVRCYSVASGTSVVSSVYIADYESLLFLSWVFFVVVFFF